MNRALVSLLFAIFVSLSLQAQTINAAYVKALYQNYPTVKTDFCPACKLWINPYYKSIADTDKHIPLIVYERFTKANNDQVKILKVPRTGIYAAWHPVYGQVNEDKLYRAANRIAKPNDIIAKGHCQAWILNAFSFDSAILSDTYTFNSACENQKQNIGTEIATENITRELLKTTDVEVWCGTFGTQGTFTDGKITAAYPSHYWTIIRHDGNLQCYWMPNLRSETQARLPDCRVTKQQLIANLGFDPMVVLQQ